MISQNTSKSKASKKVVQIIARYFVKRNQHVIYAVRSSNGVDVYHTTIINGKATGCTCPARKPCYHMVQLEQIERERPEKVAAENDKDYENAYQTAIYEALATTKDVVTPVCKGCGNREARCQPGKCYWIPSYQSL